MKAILLLVLACFAATVLASSHSESPNTADSPISDWSDLYAFRSYEPDREDYITVLANLYPLQSPFGGPNYYTISDQYFYEIYFDTNGDCTEDTGFRFLFGSQMGGEEGELTVEPSDLDCETADTSTITAPTGVTLDIGGQNVAIPLKFFQPITSTDNTGLNWFEYFSVQYWEGDRDVPFTSDVTVDGTDQTQFVKPFDYAGTNSFPDYEDYAAQYVYDIGFTEPPTPRKRGGRTYAGRMFVGQRADPFYISLGKIFDLLNLVPIPGFPGAIKENVYENDLRNTNVHVIALELPIAWLTDLGMTDGIVGIWTATRKLVHEGDDHVPGAQTSRLGNPLVNEVVIGLRDKALYSHSHPTQDGANGFGTYVTNPTFPALVNALFLKAVQDQGIEVDNLAPTNLPRDDLVAAFLTGIEGVTKSGEGVCDQLRLNTGIDITARADQDHYGVIAGDNAGFPNGRRPGDDVLDVVVQVAMGKLCWIDGLGFCEPANAPVGNVPFTDGSPVSARDFTNAFPYLNTPYPGDVQPRSADC